MLPNSDAFPPPLGTALLKADRKELASGASYFFFFICSEFCHTLKRNGHGFTCVPHPDPPSHLPLHPLPLGLPSAPSINEQN